MRGAALVAAAGVAAVAQATQATLDCPLRQIAVDMAQQLQGSFRPLSAFQDLADALNGAEEAVNCSVAPAAGAVANPAARRMVSFPLPEVGAAAAANGGLVLFVHPDPAVGSDSARGTQSAPLLTLQAALARVREARAALGISRAASASPAHLVLRAGTFHIGETLSLTAQDSNVRFQAYPSEEVFISGAVPVSGVAWTPEAAPARAAFEYRPGQLAAGFDVAPAGQYTVAQAQAFCASIPQCAGFTYDSADPNPAAAQQVSFKSATFWSNQGGWSTYVRNYGYEAGSPTPALYSAPIGGMIPQGQGVDALRVDGVRGILARYPNARTAELLGAMQIDAQKWLPQTNGTANEVEFSPPTPFRNDSAQGFFQSFHLGIGGACASRFTPQASYWCSDHSQGGGPGPYEAPVGLTVNNAPTGLPHTPYSSDISHARAHSWRAGRWFSWAFGIGSSTWDASSNSTTFNFISGGHQGSRGGNAGQEFFIEGVLDELDAPAEFFFDPTTGKLYTWLNSTTSPASHTIEIPRLAVLINATGTQADPVVGVEFAGIGFKDSAPNFMGPHGTPSGGDWAVGRSGALFFEGTIGTTIDGCLLTNLDGNGVFFSGFVRNATVQRSELSWIGETAIASWGYTDGSPVPGMGWDGSAGNQPRGTSILYNIVREVGIWTKQNSAVFQSESGQNVIMGNILYNGPRAGINFDDGFLGGSIITKNVLANFCRESSDHGPFNSWNRQTYSWLDASGNPTTQKANDTISYNWILANYHSSMAIDNDDGSSFYDTHHNVFISASAGAAYGGNSLKSDFGGHSNFHHDNLDLFWSRGFGICPQLPNYEDGYYGNTLWLGADGSYGDGQACSGPGTTVVRGNTIWSPTGAINECGMTLAQYQAQGGDPGTTAAAFPPDSTVLALARSILSVPAFE